MSTAPSARSGSLRRAAATLVVVGVAVAGCTGNDGAQRARSEPEASTAAGTAPEPALASAGTDEPTAASMVGTSSARTDRPAVASSGCGTSPVRAVLDQREVIDVDGVERWFLLSTPPEHDGQAPLPLVLDFHGLSEGAEVHGLTSEMPAYAQEHGFVAVLPQGSGEPVRWAVEPDAENNPDLRFVTRLLDRLEQRLCIDTSRVYATGFSNGAFLSSSIACALPDRFAAVAPIAGANILCDGFERPMPVFAVHGTVDPILVFNGGANLESVPGVDLTASSGKPQELPPADLEGAGYPENMMRWARFNGCARVPTEKSVADDLLMRRWDCPDGADVEFVIVLGGGHSWPGSEFTESIESIVGPTTMNLDATDAMWRFFSRFQLPDD
ncbi:MAG: PHB depolymerase family esterase [Ilumatobacteraceae bacterium]